MTDAGDVIPGAEYTVINENTGVAAPIYSDRTGATLLTAPYFADSAGTIQFFIAQGTTFRVAASGGVGTYTDRYVYGVAAAVLALADGSATINRFSTDGVLLDLKKDGTAVGSIGTASSYIYLSNSDTGIALIGGTDRIAPVNGTGGIRDAAIDLGYSGGRFRDLHLSGGVYLGGTGAANKLDDYEIGTFTPTSPHVTLISASGSYVRVGDLVHFSLVFTLPASGSGTGVSINGLPFDAWNNNSNRGGVSLGYYTFSDLTSLMSVSDTTINFFIGSTVQSYSTLAGVTFYMGGTYRAA